MDDIPAALSANTRVAVPRTVQGSALQRGILQQCAAACYLALGVALVLAVARVLHWTTALGLVWIPSTLEILALCTAGAPAVMAAAGAVTRRHRLAAVCNLLAATLLGLYTLGMICIALAAAVRIEPFLHGDLVHGEDAVVAALANALFAGATVASFRAGRGLWHASAPPRRLGPGSASSARAQELPPAALTVRRLHG